MVSFYKYFFSSNVLIEGGNVFGSTSPIKKEHIPPTINRFFKEFQEIFPKAEPHFKTIRTLGSVGKKDFSGDIDLALSEDSFKRIEDWGLSETEVKKHFELFKKRAKTSTDEQLTKRAVIVAIAEKISASNKDILIDIKGSSSGSLFCQFPQYDEGGNKTDKYVQIDINVGNIDWLSFAYHSAVYKGNVKGLHRTQLIVALFSHKGFTFSHNYGVKSKDTQEIAANSPDHAIQLLNKLYGTKFTAENIGDYFGIIKEIQSKLSPQDLNAVFDTYLKILDSTRADIPEDLQQYWINNQERLSLKGKFLPDESNLAKYKKTL
jgi:hypothetical protein